MLDEPILMESGAVSLCFRSRVAFGGRSSITYQVRSPRLGLAGVWHENLARALREFHDEADFYSAEGEAA